VERGVQGGGSVGRVHASRKGKTAKDNPKKKKGWAKSHAGSHCSAEVAIILTEFSGEIPYGLRGRENNKRKIE